MMFPKSKRIETILLEVGIEGVALTLTGSHLGGSL